MPKRSTRVAWSLLGAYTIGIGTTAVLAVADGRFERDWQGLIAQMLAFAAYSVIGALIVARRPGNAMGLLPVAAGIAILRYQLYDIDQLINRTLVYGLLTALLGAVYATAVLILGQLFGGVGQDPPSWAVAGATLAVAALFQPARARTQTLVDLRFNRRKYDAAKTIKAFSTRLRDEIDLATRSTELLAVIDQTMEPTRVSLWLRPAAHASSGTARSQAGPASWAY